MTSLHVLSNTAQTNYFISHIPQTRMYRVAAYVKTYLITFTVVVLIDV